ncbi:Chemotaxis protein CheY [Myxococcaceae bacterium]|jgi:two-component system chemotaxis response regulator CheY|nr:Chemotaxis protein CheY [Myxococcaceae bacterium]
MQKLRILVVDDSPTMRLLLSMALRRQRTFELVEATDGMDALKKLSADSFDLALVDINMPIMDGFTLIELVRKNRDFQGLPIVVVTTEGASADRDRAIQLGADDYVTKPVQPNQVLRVVNALLKVN